MTQRDFEVVATELGNHARRKKWTKERHPQGFADCLIKLHYAFRIINPAYSTSLFEDWMWDIAEGRRNLSGVLLPVAQIK